MIEIRLLNKNALAAFINSKEFESLPFIPITPHRAKSHINNPRADEEDILLLLAYEGGELVGYLGVLADRIYNGNSFEKCGWLSCMWINNKHRGKKIAFKLVQKSLEVWNNKILVTEFTDAAKGLYDKTKNFNDLTVNKGIRLYIRSDLYNLLPPKKSIFEKSKNILKTIDDSFNSYYDPRLEFKKSEKPKNLFFEFVDEVDLEIEAFIEDKTQNQLFRRNSDDLNWILKNPWVLSSKTKNPMSEKYHFSAFDKSFEFHSIKVRNKQNKLIAFLIFAKRNESLKLPYCYYGNSTQIVIDTINYFLAVWKIKTFTVFHKEIVQHLKTAKTPALLKREIKRKYIISSAFDKSIYERDFEIQDGDADCSFT